MHPEAIKILRRRRILRWLLLGALPLLLLFIIVLPAFVGVAPLDPWIRQLGQLKNNHRFFLDYRAQNADKWPTAFEDLSRTVADSPDARKPAPFVDPDTNKASPWLLFDPAHVAPLPKYGRIIAAAPRPGASRKTKDQNRRIVMFEDSVVTFIPEADFLTATQAR